ncbi:MAG: energy transducer TonB [Bryobacteraceae bacterium]
MSGARVTVSLAGIDRKEFTTSNQVVEFRLGPVPEGTYNVSASKPGFALFRTDGIQMKGGAAVDVQVVLNIGQVVERMEVRSEAPVSMKGIMQPAAASAPTTALPPPPPPSMRIRVGGEVQAAKLLYMAKPVYSSDCKAEGIEGIVTLRAMIGRDGSLLDLEQVNQLVTPRLVAAAKDAVLQRRYQPTLLNGQPVEIVTEIQINFSLAQ